MNTLTRIVLKELRKVADKIESGNCELTEEEAIDILKVVANEAMSKDQACSYLNLSRSRFDDLVREGKLPKGKKRRGFKELVWYKADLSLSIRK
jgi:predicted DNA-binding transcriptional regulator AlpA